MMMRPAVLLGWLLSGTICTVGVPSVHAAPPGPPDPERASAIILALAQGREVPGGATDLRIRATPEPQVAVLSDLGHRFAFLAPLAREAARRAAEPAWLTSEFGAETRFSLVTVRGGPEVAYVVAVVDNSRPSKGTRAPREWLWPARQLPPTDLIYDCTDEVLHGKAKPILCDLLAKPVRVFAILPAQLEQIEASATQRVPAGGAVELRVAFQDASGRVIPGSLPFCLSLRRADGVVEHTSYRVTSASGRANVLLPVDVKSAPGPRMLEIRSQCNGLTVTLPIEITAPRPAGAPALPAQRSSDQSETRWQSRPWRWTTTP